MFVNSIAISNTLTFTLVDFTRIRIQLIAIVTIILIMLKIMLVNLIFQEVKAQRSKGKYFFNIVFRKSQENT